MEMKTAEKEKKIDSLQPLSCHFHISSFENEQIFKKSNDPIISKWKKILDNHFDFSEKLFFIARSIRSTDHKHEQNIEESFGTEKETLQSFAFPTRDRKKYKNRNSDSIRFDSLHIRLDSIRLTF